MCRHVCFDILISEKFTSLCKLLVENFQGIKIDNFFDLNLINSRMKDGIYDESPMLFLTDIQQASRDNILLFLLFCIVENLSTAFLKIFRSLMWMCLTIR